MGIFKKSSDDSSGMVSYHAAANPEIVQYARDWAKDCEWVETQYDPENEFIDDIPAERLLRLINKHYVGGLKEFLHDCQPYRPEDLPRNDMK